VNTTVQSHNHVIMHRAQCITNRPAKLMQNWKISVL